MLLHNAMRENHLFIYIYCMFMFHTHRSCTQHGPMLWRFTREFNLKYVNGSKTLWRRAGECTRVKRHIFRICIRNTDYLFFSSGSLLAPLEWFEPLNRAKFCNCIALKMKMFVFNNMPVTCNTFFACNIAYNDFFSMFIVPAWRCHSTCRIMQTHACGQNWMWHKSGKL